MTSGSVGIKKAQFLKMHSMGGVTPLSLAALFICLLSTVPVHANPYVSKPGEKPVTLRIATCAVSGGFPPVYGFG